MDFVIMKPQVALQALIAGDVGYTTALGSTIRSAIRGLPLRVVMTITDKPLFALIARPGINSVEELRGKLIGISSFGASSDTLARAANSTRTETLRSSPSAAHQPRRDMAVSSWSASGAANPQRTQIAMEEIRTEQKLDGLPDPAKAFEWAFVQR